MATKLSTGSPALLCFLKQSHIFCEGFSEQSKLTFFLSPCSYEFIYFLQIVAFQKPFLLLLVLFPTLDLDTNFALISGQNIQSIFMTCFPFFFKTRTFLNFSVFIKKQQAELNFPGIQSQNILSLFYILAQFSFSSNEKEVRFQTKHLRGFYMKWKFLQLPMDKSALQHFVEKAILLNALSKIF